MPEELPLVAGVLPAPFVCFQALYNEMFALGAATAPSVKGLLIQDTTPDPTDQDKGWIPTSSGVPRFPGYVFVWNVTFGHWMARNPIAANDPSRRIYMGASADVPTYDGGDGGAPSAASGPMWMIDTAFAGSVPIGVGLIPGSSPAATIAAAGNTSDSLGASGEYKHVLTSKEMQGHFHGVGTDGAPDGNDPPTMLSRPWNIAPSPAITSRFEDNPGSGASWGDGPAIAAGTMSSTDPLASAVPSDSHNNMQPYVGAFFLKRTGRVWLVAA